MVSKIKIYMVFELVDGGEFFDKIVSFLLCKIFLNIYCDYV